MDDTAARPAQTLYGKRLLRLDADAGRAFAQRPARLAEADIENLEEEIESSGRTQLAELRLRLRVLVRHLLKESHRPEKASRSWAVTIVNQRQELEQLIIDSPSLEPKTSDMFTRAYADARKVAAAEIGLP